MSDIEDQSSFRASRSIPAEREDGAQAAAAIEELACPVWRPLTKNVLDLVQFVLWALDNEQPINDEHIIALVDAIEDTRNPHVTRHGAA